MLDFSRLAATEFVDLDGSRHLRVYYQNEDGHIKESCYDSSNGWHARVADVAVAARKNSPIAVATWNKGTNVPNFPGFLLVQLTEHKLDPCVLLGRKQEDL
jgi:hypothetical protein